MKNLVNIVILTAIVLAIVWVFIASKPGNDEYGQHMCQVTGYQPDCKTPLER